MGLKACLHVQKHCLASVSALPINMGMVSTEVVPIQTKTATQLNATPPGIVHNSNLITTWAGNASTRLFSASFPRLRWRYAESFACGPEKKLRKIVFIDAQPKKPAAAHKKAPSGHCCTQGNRRCLPCVWPYSDLAGSYGWQLLSAQES